MVTPDPFQPTARPSAVLFACNLNIIRSPMQRLCSAIWAPASMSIPVIRIGAEVDGFMIAVMAEIGIDLTAHHPKTFDELADAYYDLIIFLSPGGPASRDRDDRAMACDIEYWPTMDATLAGGGREERLAAYRQVRDHLAARIAARFGPLPPDDA